MLSRDEEQARNRNIATADASQDGVFQDDFVDIFGEPPSRSDISRFNQEPVIAPLIWSSKGLSAVDVRYQTGRPSRYVCSGEGAGDTASQTRADGSWF